MMEEGEEDVETDELDEGEEMLEEVDEFVEEGKETAICLLQCRCHGYPEGLRGGVFQAAYQVQHIPRAQDYYQDFS